MRSDGYWFRDSDVKGMVNGAVRGEETVAVAGAVSDPGYSFRAQ